MTSERMEADEIKQAVKEKYGRAALRVAGGSCGCDPVSSNLYDAAETATLRACPCQAQAGQARTPLSSVAARSVAALA